VTSFRRKSLKLCVHAHLTGVLSELSVNALYKGYAKYQNLAHANWLASLGVPLRIQQRILKHHNERTVDLRQRRGLVGRLRAGGGQSQRGGGGDDTSGLDHENGFI
jgi:hypothetical protein